MIHFRELSYRKKQIRRAFPAGRKHTAGEAGVWRRDNLPDIQGYAERMSPVLIASGLSIFAAGFLNLYVSVKKVARQIESPYYFFAATLGNVLVLSMKRNGEGPFAAICVRMIDVRMFPPLSDFKSTVAVLNLFDKFMVKDKPWSWK